MRKITLLLIVTCAFLANAQIVIFNETFGVDIEERPSVNNYTGWDNGSPVVFSCSTERYCDLRKAGTLNMHVWFGVNYEIDFLVSNIPTAGYTDLKLSFDIACNNAGGNANKLTLTCNGTTIAVPSAPVGAINTYVSSGELSISNADVTNLRFLYTVANNPTGYGYRIDNIKITGTATGEDEGEDEDGGGDEIEAPNVMEYYQPAVGKSEAGLKTALHDVIKGHTNVGYSGLWNVYETSDMTAYGKVWDMYSTCTWTYRSDQCGNYSSVCDCYNREHSIPQSWFGERSPMVSDAFHIYPTDGRVNGQRGNYPFGECANGTSLGGKALGKLGASTFSGYSGTVFEPIDEYKGDFARTYFYFATRYQNEMSSINGASFTKNTYPSLSEWSINLFLKWHRQDPVSEKETDRNDAVQKHQKNRNPFIDYPELAEYIWGNKKGNAWKTTSGLSEITVEFNIAPNPVRDQLTIKTKEPELTYTIYNLSGQSLQNGTVTTGSKNISVDYLQNGMYLIRMLAGTRQAVRRFIVTK